jgi:hypothetical protein
LFEQRGGLDYVLLIRFRITFALQLLKCNNDWVNRFPCLVISAVKVLVPQI